MPSHHDLWAKELVRERGLEPPPLAGPDPKSGVSAISPLAQTGDKDATLNSNLKCAFIQRR
jgi:hypothetical protein